MNEIEIHYYRSIGDIKRANDRAGLHFFEASSMRFFNSRVLDGIYGGKLFVTSEKFDYASPRLYTVRIAHPDGSVESFSDFQEFKRADQAKRFAQRWALLGDVFGWDIDTIREQGK